MSSDVKKCKFCIVEIDESMLEAYRCAQKHNWCYGICSNFEEKEDIFMGFYSFEDLREKDEVGKRDILEQNRAKTELDGACKDEFSGLKEDIFEQKGGDFVAKIDEKLLFARQLKHNICDFDFDFLGRYKLEKEEAEKLKAVLEEYISLVTPRKEG